MTPHYTTDDPRDLSLSQTELLREGMLADAACRIEAPHSSNVCLLQVSLVMPFSMDWILWASIALPTFYKHVVGVVGRRAQKQMTWSYTGFVVAFMTDEKPVRYRAEMQLPGKAVGDKWLSIDLEASVTVSSSDLIFPASSSFPHMAPEALSSSAVLPCVSARTATKAGLWSSDIRPSCIKLAIAVIASGWDCCHRALCHRYGIEYSLKSMVMA
jgi:hypothetical protein